MWLYIWKFCLEGLQKEEASSVWEEAFLDEDDVLTRGKEVDVDVWTCSLICNGEGSSSSGDNAGSDPGSPEDEARAGKNFFDFSGS